MRIIEKHCDKIATIWQVDSNRAMGLMTDLIIKMTL